MQDEKWSKENLEKMLEISHNKADVLRNMGLEPNGGNQRSLNAKLRFYGLEVKNKMQKALESCDIERMVKDATSFRDVLLRLKLGETGANYRNIQKFFADNPEYDISHFTGTAWSKGKTAKTHKSILKNAKKQEIKHEHLFCENSKHTYTVARSHIIKYKLKDYKCEICNISEWCGAELALHLDHINGINNDHRLENLRFLCPNCHQQTHTWGNKNQNEQKS